MPDEGCIMAGIALQLTSPVVAAAAAMVMVMPGMPDEGDIMAGIATDATGIATGISSLQSGLETPDVALNLRKQGDSVVSSFILLSIVALYR
jgi:hypothetical protein